MDGKSVLLCSLCDFRCFNNSTLLQHVRAVHTNDPNFQVNCSVCGRSFKKYNTLKKHLHRKHSAADPDLDSSDDDMDEEQPCQTNEDCDLVHIDSHSVDPNWENAKFLLRVTHEQSLTYDGIEKFCDSVQDFTEILYDKMAQQIKQRLTDHQGSTIDESITQDLLRICEPVDLFPNLRTRHSREQYYEMNFNYQAPTPVFMGSEQQWIMRKGHLRLEDIQHYGYTIDFLSSLKALLENPAIRTEVGKCHSTHNNVMKDFCDAIFFKDHPVFRSNPLALQVVLYYDDIEVANPLGSKAGNHKLGCFYYTIGNIRPIYRSHLRTIQLLAIAKTHDIRAYGFDSLLQQFVAQINQLASDEGYEAEIGGRMVKLHGAVICLLGDTPGSNFIGGFKEGIGFSLRKCRRCMAVNDDICKKFDAEELIHRDLNNHLKYLDLISTERSGWHSTTYGINNSSILSELKGFDVTKCLPFDIMHSIFEGVSNRHLNLLFYHIIDSQQIRLTDINEAIKSHQYGYSETDTKPKCIERESSTSDFTVKQSASQMMTLILLLPFMIGDYIRDEDIHWECFLVLWDICAMICAHEVTAENSAQLGCLVKTYLESFTELYGEEKITPKMHHLVHLPEQIMLFGPLRNQWCMRYESKNGQIKRFISHNYKNVALTAATHHQQWMCYHLATRPGQEDSNFLYAGDEIGSGTICEIEVENIPQLQSELMPISRVTALRVTYVKIHGIKYCSQAVVRVKKPTPDDYEPFLYCKIKNIYVYKDAKIFEAEAMQIILYNDNLRAIQVTTTNQTLWCLYTDFFCHGVLHLKRKAGNVFVIDKQFWTCHF